MPVRVVSRLVVEWREDGHSWCPETKELGGVHYCKLQKWDCKFISFAKDAALDLQKCPDYNIGIVDELCRLRNHACDKALAEMAAEAAAAKAALTAEADAARLAEDLATPSRGRFFFSAEFEAVFCKAKCATEIDVALDPPHPFAGNAKELPFFFTNIKSVDLKSRLSSTNCKWQTNIALANYNYVIIFI
jgi:hypothetical protein